MSHQRQLARRITHLAPLLVLLLAFGLQLRYLAELRAMFPAGFDQPFCGVDALAHYNRAQQLLAGALPGDQTYFFIPLYPFYLAGLMKLFSDSLLLPVLMQALLQLVGLAALYGIGRIAFSRTAGLLAMLGLATYNYYLFYLPCYDQTLLTTPLLTLGVFFLLTFYRRGQARWVVAAGIALGLAALSRPTVLLTLPVASLWLGWLCWPVSGLKLEVDGGPPNPPAGEIGSSSPPFGGARGAYNAVGRSLRAWIGYSILLIAPFILLVSPITLHNYRVSGRFILISDNFDVNIFTGNNPDALGLDSLAHAQSQPAVLRFLQTLQRVDAGETTFPAEVLRYYREQPGDALALNLRKTWLWFGQSTELLVEPFFPLRVTQAATLARLPLLWQPLVVVALLGIVLGQKRAWPPVVLLWAVYGVFSLGSILFFIQLRFRLPFIPLVMLFAASLLAMAPHWAGRQPRRFWSVVAGLLLLLPLLPGLSLFILIFLGLGLAQGRWRLPRYRGAAIAIVAYLLLVNLWAQAEAAASDIAQRIDIYLGPPLAGESVLGQTFTMDCNGLNSVEVTLGVLGPAPDQPVTFTLTPDPASPDVLYSETFDSRSVRDFERKAFVFPPIPDSAGQNYFFYLSSPTAAPDNAITARGYSDTPVDYFPGGRAYAGRLAGLQPQQADFAFTAKCDLSLWQKLRQALWQ
ncbi:MAG: glycosyltransferase family 39 protein [Anaerolineaceae bacterium]|nr:glycosyltransferase family 39 protein [Anaerolineaceae bacterium]